MQWKGLMLCNSNENSDGEIESRGLPTIHAQTLEVDRSLKLLKKQTRAPHSRLFF